MICLPGFNQNVSDLQVLFSQPLVTGYTIITLCLFHHESTFPQSRLPQFPLKKEELVKIIELLCGRESVEKFALLGYSIGARIAACLLPVMSDKIEKFILLAPDGIVMNKWYTFLMHTFLGSRLFNFSRQHCHQLIRITKLLRSARVISVTERKIVLKSLESRLTIDKVWMTWQTYKEIHLPLESWVKIVNLEKFDSYFFFGKYDGVVDKNSMDKLSVVLNDPNKIISLDSGHNLLNRKSVEKITAVLLRQA